MPTISPSQETPRTPWWLWPQVLCLDAPAVAVAWMAVLAHGHRLQLPAAFYGGLALVTWMIYLLDRTADAISGRLPRPLSCRHAFCLRHAKLILWGVLPLTAGLTLWLALTALPVGLLGQGLLLSLGGTIYLASYSTQRHSRLHAVLLLLAVVVGTVLVELWHAPPLFRGIALLALLAMIVQARRERPTTRTLVPKEALASLLFALGSSAGVHFWTPAEHGLLCSETTLMWGLFALNMMSIVRSEQLTGRHGDPLASPSLQSGLNHYLLGAVLLMMSGWNLFQAGNNGLRHTSLLVGLSVLLLAALHTKAHRLSTERFHVLADAALLLPLPLLWWLA